MKTTSLEIKPKLAYELEKRNQNILAISFSANGPSS